MLPLISVGFTLAFWSWLITSSYPWGVRPDESDERPGNLPIVTGLGCVALAGGRDSIAGFRLGGGFLAGSGFSCPGGGGNGFCDISGREGNGFCRRSVEVTEQEWRRLVSGRGAGGLSLSWNVWTRLGGLDGTSSSIEQYPSASSAL